LALEDLKWKTRVEVSAAALPVLSRLADNPMRLNELATALHVTGPAVSRQVQLLYDKGLVERTQDQNDARATIVRLTPKGAEVVSEAAQARMALLRQVLAGWSDEAVASLAPVLDRLAEELGKWDHR
jgi:DNA-binding MarR family transcriptional regulator